ncbi:MAG: sigma-70 family RNA polymerase sigma factor [Bacteroidetes bacterium]|nr:sigma-70 family RNA polymerase sigma factor [Bacteroidota bacterium]
MAYKDDNFYLEQIKRGNTDAYAMLINKHKTMAFNVALRVTHNREDAEEVIQDAFLKVYYSLKDFEGKSKFTTWLFRIVYNQAISKIRKKTIDQHTIDEEIIDNFTVSEISNGLTYLKAEEQTKYINLVLAKLTEEDSTIVTLFYLNESSVEEVSEITGLSEANVKVKLHRSRKKLYDELKLLLSNEVNTLI